MCLLPWIALTLVGCTGGTVPSDLSAVEGAAEDGYDQALAGDREAFGTQATLIAHAWDSLRSVVEADGAPEQTLTLMDSSVASLATAATDAEGATVRARAANAVSGCMDDLFTLYNPQVPSELLELDYRGHEIILDALDVTLVGAITDVQVMDDFWGTLRGRVVRKDRDVAEAFDQSLEDLRSARDSLDVQATQDAAGETLDQIDVLEGLFR
jgi:hypothetical protein